LFQCGVRDWCVENDDFNCCTHVAKSSFDAAVASVGWDFLYFIFRQSLLGGSDNRWLEFTLVLQY
jgi:hypothetical protein